MQANRTAEIPTTANAAARSSLEAGKVERKMLRSLPVDTQDLLQTGTARAQWITSNALNSLSARAEYLADIPISAGRYLLAPLVSEKFGAWQYATMWPPAATHVNN